MTSDFPQGDLLSLVGIAHSVDLVLSRQGLAECAAVALAELGCAKVQLRVQPDNERVLEFYQRLGYGPDAAIDLGERLIEDS
ncbi:GNAT family N-acetyltransferase [Schumannella soli]|uniref:N-acetyltransferase domain-containing protein n=1 Tax=Schumannella soli TaxID=2590779 RepID=A0A506Y691_9MICO|nr:GNAT family N-acetyltransferase [Schumannella soli]TPW77542.1 hypothetical protein FJ657_02360 [Schumannella soli]